MIDRSIMERLRRSFSGRTVIHALCPIPFQKTVCDNRRILRFPSTCSICLGSKSCSASQVSFQLPWLFSIWSKSGRISEGKKARYSTECTNSGKSTRNNPPGKSKPNIRAPQGFGSCGRGFRKR